MAQRRLFTVTTPLGDRVFLTRDRWREIIRFKHPAMAGHEKVVRECLESPVAICESEKDDEADQERQANNGQAKSLF